MMNDLVCVGRSRGALTTYITTAEVIANQRQVYTRSLLQYAYGYCECTAQFLEFYLFIYSRKKSYK